MNKICRLIIFNFIFGYFLGKFFKFSISKSFLQMSPLEMVFVVWVSASLIGGFWFLGYMFYHWGIHKFLSKKIKIIWFWILSIGLPFYLVGPLIYYIFVYEMKKGLYDKPDGELENKRNCCTQKS